MDDGKIISLDEIRERIYFIRGHKVMLDRDLAFLYGVSTGALNQSVRRNIDRFPEDFMFQLTPDECRILMSHFVISSSRHGGTRKMPHAFTEQGVAMLSSILRSKRAIKVNIQIIRTFTKLRQSISENEDLRRKIEALEDRYDKQFKIVFDAIRQLIDNDEAQDVIGFKGP